MDGQKAAAAAPERAPGRHSTLFNLAVRAVATFSLAFGLLLIDPFDFNTVLDRTGREAFYRVVAPTFELEDTSATVVLIDDEFLRTQGSHWPLPYLMHGELLGTIASFEPASLTVDILFFDELPDQTLNGFIQRLESIAETTPVFLAAASEETGAPIPIRPELEALDARSEGVSLVSVVFGEGRSSDYAYQLGPDKAGRTSAAIAAYEAVCATRTAGCQAIERVDLDLVWGLPPEVNCRGGAAEACSKIGRAPLLRAVRILAGGVLGRLAIGPLNEPNPVTIPGIPTIGAGAVAEGAYRDQLDELIRGRSVFYGARIVASGDTLRSPVNGETAGVYAHATALANLEAFGDGFVRADPPFNLNKNVHLALVLAIAIAFGFGVEMVAHRIGLRGGGRLRVQIVAYIVLALTIVMIEFETLRSGPANWWSIIAAVTLARWSLGQLGDTDAERAS